jgi:hypothetical protein
MRSWLGLIEMFVILLFALGWGVLELVASRLDKKPNAKTDVEDAGGSAAALLTASPSPPAARHAKRQ